MLQTPKSHFLSGARVAQNRQREIFAHGTPKNPAGEIVYNMRGQTRALMRRASSPVLCGVRNKCVFMHETRGGPSHHHKRTRCAPDTKYNIVCGYRCGEGSGIRARNEEIPHSCADEAYTTRIQRTHYWVDTRECVRFIIWRVSLWRGTPDEKPLGGTRDVERASAFNWIFMLF